MPFRGKRGEEERINSEKTERERGKKERARVHISVEITGKSARFWERAD